MCLKKQGSRGAHAPLYSDFSDGGGQMSTRIFVRSGKTGLPAGGFWQIGGELIRLGGKKTEETKPRLPFDTWAAVA